MFVPQINFSFSLSSHSSNRVSYRTLCDVLSPLVHVGALRDGGAALLFVIPATVGVPGLHAETNKERVSNC